MNIKEYIWIFYSSVRTACVFSIRHITMQCHTVVMENEEMIDIYCSVCISEAAKKEEEARANKARQDKLWTKPSYVIIIHKLSLLLCLFSRSLAHSLALGTRQE